MNNKSPLRYPGGKTRACKILDKIVSEHFNMKEKKILISPFLGGGSFEFYLQNKYNLEIIANDKFNPLFVFWYFCKYCIIIEYYFYWSSIITSSSHVDTSWYSGGCTYNRNGCRCKCSNF